MRTMAHVGLDKAAALIPVQENGDYAKSDLLDLKVAAEQALEGATPNFAPSEGVRGFDPYERLEIGSSLYP